jgi:hypothetical protein
MKRLALFAAALLALPPAARADQAADKHMVELAFDTCLAYPDDAERLKFHLDANFTPAGDKSSAFFLGRNQGKVWLDHENDVNYAIVLFDSGRCAVESDAASIEGVIQAFATHAVSAKLDAQRTADDAHGSFRGAPGHVETYAWTYDGHPYRIGVEGTPLAKALVHAEIFAERAP